MPPRKPKPKIEILDLDQAAIPDPRNVNKHSQRGAGLLENSIRKRGAFRSIASAGKGAAVPVVYAGNFTLEKALDAGITQVINVHTTGNQLVNVVRDDIAPGSPEAVALGLEDNEISKQSYNPDIDLLAALASGDDAILSGVRSEDDIFSAMVENMLDQAQRSPRNDEDPDTVILEQAVQLKPSQDYIIVVCETPEEWEQLKSFLALPYVRRGGYKRGSAFDSVGIQRVIRSSDLFRIMDDHRDPE